MISNSKKFLLLCLIIFNFNSLLSRDFITVWDLSKPGRNQNELTFGVQALGTVHYTWQTIPSGASGSGSIQIGAFYECTIPGLPTNSIVRISFQTGLQRFFALYNSNNQNDAQRLIDVEQWGSSQWINMSNMFLQCHNLNISATDIPDLSLVEDMSQMFRYCINLTGPSNINLWNTSNVKYMSGMFYFALDFNQSIENWDVSKVEYMDYMFYYDSIFNQPLSNWDVSKVKDMSYMFGYSNFNQPIGNWIVDSLKHTTAMFLRNNQFNQPIGNWNTSNVESMNEMFKEAVSFNQPLTQWNTANVKYMNSMFEGATEFNQYIGNWNTANVENMKSMFYYATQFNQPIGNWNTSKVNDMSFMFYNATSFNQSLEFWNTSQVKNISGMFSYATSFNQSLTHWDLSLATDKMFVFNHAHSFNQPLDGWKINSFDKLNYMLDSCGMDCKNYSITLTSWAAQAPDSVQLDGVSLLTYGNDVIAHRDYLIQVKGWTFFGDNPSGTNCLPNYISGFLFLDTNGNSSYDSLDFCIKNKWVRASNGVQNGFGFSDSIGQYKIYLPDTLGNYLVETQNITNHIISSPTSQNYSLAGNQSYTNINFGFANQGYNNMEIDTWAGPARNGFINYLTLQVCNNGNQNMQDSLSLILPAGFLFHSCNINPIQNNQILTWNYNLNPFECQSFIIYYSIPLAVNLGSTFTFYCTVYPDSDFISINNHDSVSVTVTGSYDPNDKQTDQSKMIEFGTSSTIDYTIRFQNVGTDTAFNIVILDTLDNNINLASFQLLDFSHPCVTEILSGSVLKWTFKNILLPHSAVNENASNGYIRYRVEIKDNLTPPIQVQNKAYIYFDYNSAIITNTTLNNFVVVSLDEYHKPIAKVYPNPFNDVLYLELNDIQQVSFQLFNSLGCLVYSENINKSGPLNLDIPTGIYFYKLIAGNQKQNGKIIKTN